MEYLQRYLRMLTFCANGLPCMAIGGGMPLLVLDPGTGWFAQPVFRPKKDEDVVPDEIQKVVDALVRK